MQQVQRLLKGNIVRTSTGENVPLMNSPDPNSHPEICPLCRLIAEVSDTDLKADA